METIEIATNLIEIIFHGRWQTQYWLLIGPWSIYYWFALYTANTPAPPRHLTFRI